VAGMARANRPPGRESPARSDRRRDVSLFDRFAWAYDIAMSPTAGDRLREALALAERPVERVIDVGGGTGRGVRALDVGRRLVVDPAPGMLRAVPAGIDRIRANATRLPLQTDGADATLVLDALHHMPDHAVVARELFRTVRPGGVAVVRDFDPLTLRGRALSAAERLVGFESAFHAPDAVGELLMDAGFEPSVLDRGFTYTVVGVVPPK